jgi:hypothetical protein
VQNKISRNPQRYKHIKINKPYFGDAIWRIYGVAHLYFFCSKGRLFWVKFWFLCQANNNWN